MVSTDFAIKNTSSLPALPEIVLDSLATQRPVSCFILILLFTTVIFGSIMQFSVVLKKLRPVDLHGASVITVLGTAGILDPLGFITIFWAIDKVGVFMFILCVMTLQAAGILKIAGIYGLAKAISLVVFYGVLNDSESMPLFQYRVLELLACLFILPALFVPIPSLKTDLSEKALIPK